MQQKEMGNGKGVRLPWAATTKNALESLIMLYRLNRSVQFQVTFSGNNKNYF